MSFTAGGPRPWPVMADWSNGVQESLAWLTDIKSASLGGSTQHTAIRETPRRTFTVTVTAEAQERRVADALLAGWSGMWQMPVWPDVQRLAAAVADGALSVPCRVDGFDFVAGGGALIWRAVNVWEVVQVAEVQADGLLLSAETTQAWRAGDRLYPLRAARIVESPEHTVWHDNAGRRSITFTLTDASAWPVLTDLPQYLGHPVLEQRPDETESPRHTSGRTLTVVDGEAGPAEYFDLIGVPLPTARHSWKAFGREEHTWLRSLLYTACGSSTPLWMPSWTADLRVVADIAANAAAITVEWAGYTRFGRNVANRRDVRIELAGGQVFYRRITAAAEAAGNEVLALDAPLGLAVPAARVRRISFMALSVLASDEVSLQHMTDADGVATASLTWIAVVPDV